MEKKNVMDFDTSKLIDMILEEVSSGGTVVNACQNFEEYTRGFVKSSTAKFVFFTKLKKLYEHEYAAARRKGKEVREELKRAAEEVVDQESTVTLDGIIEMVKVYKRQQKEEGKDVKKEIKELNGIIEGLQAKVERLEEELEIINDFAEAKKQENKRLIETIRTLNGLGFDIEEPSTKYQVNNQGLVETA